MTERLDEMIDVLCDILYNVSKDLTEEDLDRIEEKGLYMDRDLLQYARTRSKSK